MAQVMGTFGNHMDQDLVQGDVAPLLRPPWNCSGGVSGQCFDGRVASLCAAAKWCSSMMSARDSSAVAHMSESGAAPSSSHGRCLPLGRPNTTPK